MLRLGTAISAFCQILFNGERALAWKGLERPAIEEKIDDKNEQNDDKKLNGEAIYSLLLLQREGRLIDFLQEDITSFADAQIGAAVRQVHAGCRKVLDEHFTIEPIREEAESSAVEIKKGFNPSAIRLTGDIKGEPPFKGTLRHKGWKVTKTSLPERHKNLDASIICPAEVEI